MALKKEMFGSLPTGEEVLLYTITNESGASVSLSTLGAGWVRAMMPDKTGTMTDVILGFDEPQPYTDPDNGFQGLVVGRVANRIKGGAFDIDGVSYHLPKNMNGVATLHSDGMLSFRVWQVKGTTENSVTFCTESPDMEKGFPGNVQVEVTYTFSEENALRIDYNAVTDKKTPVNLTNHAYFNLAGSGKIYDHVLTIFADSYTECDENIVPNGRLCPVEGTPLDFRAPRRIGDDIDKEIPLLTNVGGYDHNFCLRGAAGEMSPCAVLEDPLSGRVLSVFTDLPGVQLYTSNCLPDGVPAKNGSELGHRRGLCLETQFYPDSVHHADFPNCMMEPGEPFHSVTEFRFSVK